jgi:hypothetical protein
MKRLYRLASNGCQCKVILAVDPEWWTRPFYGVASFKFRQSIARLSTERHIWLNSYSSLTESLPFPLPSSAISLPGLGDREHGRDWRSFGRYCHSQGRAAPMGVVDPQF